MPELVIRPAAPASGRITPASFPFYTSGEDNLRITSWNSAAGVKLKINGRLLDGAGRPSADSWDHTPNTDRSARSTDLPLSGTTLLNITVFASAGTPQMGQTLVKVELIRGIGTAALVLGTILFGAVTATQAIGFPGSAIQTSLDVGGYYRTITGSAPGGGQPILETVPTGARWELRGVTHSVLYGPVANFPLQFEVLDASGNIVCGVYSQHNYPGSGATYQSSWTSGYGVPYTNSAPPRPQLYSGLPFPLVMLAGAAFRVINTGSVITLGAPTYQVREWVEP